MIFLSNLKGGECFLLLGLGASVISSDLKEGECNLP